MGSIEFSKFEASWLFRRKTFTSADVHSSQLQRCLGLMELTALGIGATLGAGIYVVTPESTRTSGGPAMCIAFLIAAVASVLSGLCYAELGARVPRAGSAYVYTYVAVGELWAFIVGWNMILEYVIGTASVARAAVTYIDVLANGTLEATFREAMPINISFLGQYFDPVAFGVTMFLTVLLAVGVSESTFVNNILVMINCGVLVYIITIGFVYAKPEYWELTLEQVQKATGTNGTEYGTGGFMPYGFGGVMTAASAAFYSFVGFDCIATTGEEVANPKRNIPLSIVLSLGVCALAYFCVSVVFTLDTPYYELSQKTLLPTVPYGTTVVSLGAILCASTSLLGGMFPLPRVIYAMAEDGLLFSFLANINRRFKTPMLATLLSGLLTASFAALFDVAQLVDMLSIGTLMAYSLVAASVLVLRYKVSFIDTHDEEDGNSMTNYGSSDAPSTIQSSGSHRHCRSKGDYIKAIFNLSEPKDSTKPTEFSSNLAVLISCIITVLLIGTVSFATVLVKNPNKEWWPFIGIGGCGFFASLLTARLWLLPQNRRFKTFQVPLVPLFPVLALAVNFYLLVSLNYFTWIRFAIWMALGFVIFLFYGLWQSKERDTGALLAAASSAEVVDGAIARGPENNWSNQVNVEAECHHTANSFPDSSPGHFHDQ